MEMVRKLEDTVAKWMEAMPHLPVGGRKWLADNVWWIVIVGLSLSAIGIIVTVGNLINYLNVLSAFSAFVPVGTLGAGWVITTTIVSIVFTIMQIVLLAFAVKPLKAHQKLGWSLLFLTALVGAVAAVIGGALSLNVLSLLLSVLFGAIFLGIALYFIFEIRSHFGGSIQMAASKKSETTASASRTTSDK